MNNYTRIIIIGCACLFFGCKDKWQEALEKIDQSLLHNNNYQGWELIQKIESEWDTNYTIKKNDNDTLKILFFLEGKKDGLINVNGYRKKFRCDADTCNLEMTSQDTLFFYRQNVNGEKKFEVGEYAYRFTYFKMDSTEANYYLKHTDSLRRVRGNNLSKLSKE